MPDLTTIDTSKVPAITDAFTIEFHRYGEWEGKPSGDPALGVDLPTHGALQLTLADGTVVAISASEWATMKAFPPHG